MMYRGLVESDCDPKNLQRVQVRVMGLHSQDKSELPTECLPWAEPAIPITAGTLNSGKGVFDTPSIGDFVWLFFEDEWFQLPHYFAVIRTEKDKNSDFNQPKDIESSKNDDRKNRNRVEKDRWNNRKYIDENKCETNDSWNNKSLIDKDHEEYKDHFNNHFYLDINKFVFVNGSETVEITYDKKGNVDIWSNTGGIITLGNSVTCSAVNWTYLNNWMTQIENAINTLRLAIDGHTHIGNLGYTTGPGLSGPTTSALTQIIDGINTLITQIHPKVESPKLQIPQNEDI